MSKITFLKLISLCKKWSWWWYTVNGRSQFKWKMYSNVLVGNLYTDIVLCTVYFVLFIPNVSKTIIINNILHICQFFNNLSTDMHDSKRYYIHLHYKKVLIFLVLYVAIFRESIMWNYIQATNDVKIDFFVTCTTKPIETQLFPELEKFYNIHKATTSKLYYNCVANWSINCLL